MPAAPAASCALCIGRTHTSKRVHRNHPTFPHAMVLTVSFVLSPVTGLFCHRRLRIKVLSAPGRADLPSANLTPASGRQDHTTSPYAAPSFVRSLGDRSQASSTCPAIPSRAKRCRVHRIPPRVRDDGQRPSVGWDAKSSRCDLGGVGTEIFLQRGLDTKLPDGQIITRRESTFRSCPGRGAASFTPLRTAWTRVATGAADP